MCKNTCVSNKKCMRRGKEKQIQGQMQPHHFRFLKVNQYLKPTAVSNYIFKYPMESSQTTRLHIARSRTAVPAKWASINVSKFWKRWNSIVEKTTEADTIHTGMLLLARPSATTHPTTLQSSASEFPQVESCVLLPSLSFGGSTKSNCLGGRESKNEAHVCESGSAELQTLKRACLCLEWKRNMYLARAATTHYIFITE